MTGYPKGATKALGWMLTLAAFVGVVPPTMALDADHLILSEIVAETHPNFISTGSSYIQVVNPTGSPVTMDQVYITNGTFFSAVYYYNLPLGDPATHNPGGGTGGSFHARFPSGYVLAAGDSLAISIDGSDHYLERYGRLPDFELFEDANAPDMVPELLEVFPGSINAGSIVGGTNTPALGISSGTVILYTWDGASDLVQDLDYLIWGTNTGVRADKTGVTIGSETYLDDTPVADQEQVPGDGPRLRHSLRRISADEGSESLSGGNGVDGHDETSENLATTWRDVDFTVEGHGVPSAPGSFHPAAPIFVATGMSPAAPSDGQEVVLSATLVSNSTISNVTFHYTVDGGSLIDLAGANTTGDEYVATVPAQVAGSVLVWYVTSGNADGGIAVFPAAAPAYSGNWTVAEAPNPSDFPAKLLITEVATVGSAQEFVEIYNPGTEDVDMGNYYLTDANYSPGGQYYWRITEGTPNSGTIGGGAFSDFHSQFPEEFILAAGDTIVVSVAGSQDFSAFYGFLPDLELYEDDDFPDIVQDMRWVFGDEVDNSIINRTGSIPSTPTLSNGAETVILYHWDGTSDGITDIDVFHWKDSESTTTSHFFNKTNVTIGSHSYLPEVGTGLSTTFPLEASFGLSYHRIDATEGNQSPSGSNGVLGRDETSEDLFNTFELAEYDPSRPSESEGGGGGTMELVVEAKTFIPTMGELMPIRFVSNARSETRLRLFDMEGRLIFTLWDSRRNGPPSVVPGAYTIVNWDGRDNHYERVRAGLYILHLSVVDNRTGEEEVQTAPVVVATRLSK